MSNLIAISGSLRKGSYNTALLRAALEVLPAGTSMEIASIRDIPLYDGDQEESVGVPSPVEELKRRIDSSDGLLIATPEYNHGVPGVLKNAIDWMTRPPGDVRRVFGGKAVGLMGATPGAGGTRFAQAGWLPILHALGMRVWSGRQIYVARASTVFDEKGVMVDDRLRERLASYLEGFSFFAGNLQNVRS